MKESIQALTSGTDVKSKSMPDSTEGSHTQIAAHMDYIFHVCFSLSNLKFRFTHCVWVFKRRCPQASHLALDTGCSV